MNKQEHIKLTLQIQYQNNKAAIVAAIEKSFLTLFWIDIVTKRRQETIRLIRNLGSVFE
jgi:uncharacterized protein YebE (UPF0316 family)